MTEVLARQFFITIIGFLFITVLACDSDQEKFDLLIDDVVFHVELATTPAQHREGLMLRTELAEREGMLFIFKHEQILSFWMKDTSIPLSIAFIDGRGIIVHIRDMVPFSTLPVSSAMPVRFAFEVNRGAFNRAGIKVGSKVKLPQIVR